MTTDAIEAGARADLLLKLETAFLVSLAENNCPTDIAEFLVRGDPMRGVPPRLVQKAIAAAIASGALVPASQLAAERERCAEIAENPGFIQAQDTEWDLGVNYAKQFIAKAIRAASPNGRAGT